MFSILSNIMINRCNKCSQFAVMYMTRIIGIQSAATTTTSN